MSRRGRAERMAAKWRVITGAYLRSGCEWRKRKGSGKRERGKREISRFSRFSHADNFDELAQKTRGVHRGEREQTRKRETEIVLPCRGYNLRGHHVSFAEIINSLFHNYYNVFAKTSMISTISADAMRRDAIPSRIENPCALLARNHRTDNIINDILPSEMVKLVKFTIIILPRFHRPITKCNR